MCLACGFVLELPLMALFVLFPTASLPVISTMLLIFAWSVSDWKNKGWSFASIVTLCTIFYFNPYTAMFAIITMTSAFAGYSYIKGRLSLWHI